MFLKLFRERLTWQALAAIFVYASSAVLITFPLAVRVGLSIYNYGDVLVHTWKIGWNSYQLLNNPFGLYNAPVFYPYVGTLAFSNNFITQSLFALPIVTATGNYALGLNLNVFVAFILNGLGMYLLLRDWKVNFAGALVGGFIYSFGHYHLNQFSHLALLSSQWFPFVLLYLNRSLRTFRARHFFLFGIFLWLSVNSAVYYAFFTTAMLLVYGMFLLARARGRFPRRAWVGILVASFAVLLLTLPFILPYFQLSSTLGLGRRVTEIESLAAVPSSYLSSMTQNEPFVSLALPLRHVEAALSPGLFALLLALYALTTRANPALIVGLGLVALLGMVLSFGIALHLDALTIPLPYKFLYDYVPGIANSMRVTARWAVLVLLGVAGIAGLGMGVLLDRIQPRWRFAPLVLTGVVLVGLTLEYNQSPLRLMTGTLLRQETPPEYEWLKQQPDAAVLELPMGLLSTSYSFDSWYQYYTLVHHHPLVNGAAGFTPPTYDSVDTAMEHFPSADAIDLARALNVRYLIVHPETATTWQANRERAALFPQTLQQVRQFDNAVVFDITPRPPAPDFAVQLQLPDRVPPNAPLRAFLFAHSAVAQHQVFSQPGLLDIKTEWRSPNGTLVKTESKRIRAPLLLTQAGVVIPFQVTVPAQEGTYQLVVEVGGMSQARNFERAVTIASAPDAVETPALELQEAYVSPRATRGLETMDITLAWQARSRLAANYDVFIHIQDANGETRADINAPPYSGGLPTSSWLPGETIVEQYHIPIPGGLPQGAYSVVVGIADPRTHTPIPILDSDGSTVNAIKLDARAYIGKGWNSAPLKPMFPASVDFGDWVRFAGYDLAGTEFAPGDSLPLNLYWIGRERTADTFTLFVHLTNAQHQLVAQSDAPPLGGAYPTSAWNDGEWIRDPHPLALPKDLPAGEYSIEIGWYNPLTGVRVPLNTDASADSLRVATIRVRSAPKP